jgi:predicted nucleotidyltransferase
MNTLTKDLIDELIERLVTEFQPQQVWLFGSHAWGLPDESSDVDLLVVIEDSTESPIRRAQRAHRCLRGLGIAKDVLVKTRAEVERFRHVPASLEAEIFDRGRKLYG